MKSKSFVSALITVLAAIMVFLSHESATTGYQYESRTDHFESTGEAPSVIESETIHFDAGMVKAICFEVAKNSDKLSKLKPHHKGNNGIERSIESYIIYSNTLPHHCPGLYKLQRLNT